MKEFCKSPVSENALLRRINHRLARHGRRVRREKLSSAGYENKDVGRYYMVDMSTGVAVRSQIDLEELGRELAALHEHEVVEW